MAHMRVQQTHTHVHVSMHTRTHTHMYTDEARDKDIPLLTKDCQRCKTSRKGFPLSQNNQLCQHPDLGLVASQTVREYISLV